MIFSLFSEQSDCETLAQLLARLTDHPFSHNLLMAQFLVAVFTRLNQGETERKYQELLAANGKKAPQAPGKKSIGSMALWFVILTSGLVPTVEMGIKWNDIRGVQKLDSPGQLIPLLLSLGQLVHVLYSILRGQDSLEKHLAEKPTTSKYMYLKGGLHLFAS